jgi:exopolysaccharide biosynthesis polyprenyl glycosylphosphotransferase
MVRENAGILAFLARVKDASVVTLAFGAAFSLRFQVSALVAVGLVKAHVGPPPDEDYLRALPVVLVTFLAALHLSGLYEPRRTHGALREAWGAFKASVVSIVLLLALAEVSRRYSRSFAGIFAVLAPLLLCSSRAVERALLATLRRRGWNIRRALVIGEGELCRDLVRKLVASPWTGIELQGVLALSDGAASEEKLEGVPVLGTFRDVRQVAKEKAIDQVLLAVPLERAPLLRELRVLLDALPIDVGLVPDTAGFLPIRPTVTELDGLPLVTIRRAPAAGWGGFLKRTLDIAGAGLGLVLFSPVVAVLALLIRAIEGGPVLYRQERVGWGGRPFVMLKLRTMVADAEATTGAVRTQRGDPRRTRLGTFLRRTSLDELPQLWNVLKGDMSLVGPRPERPEFLEELRKELPDYMLRLTVKAGMTGLAQIHGLRGDSSLAERLKLDLDYVRRWSLRLDLEILALTFVRGFVHENAF